MLKRFSELCTRFNIPIPELELSNGNEEITSAKKVCLTEDADIYHVFGHYLADLHQEKPDLVADTIKEFMIYYLGPPWRGYE